MGSEALWILESCFDFCLSWHRVQGNSDADDWTQGTGTGKVSTPWPRPELLWHRRENSQWSALVMMITHSDSTFMPSLARDSVALYHTLHPSQRSAFLAPVPARLMTKSEPVDHLMGSSELCVHFHQSSELFTSPGSGALRPASRLTFSPVTESCLTSDWLIRPNTGLWLADIWGDPLALIFWAARPRSITKMSTECFSGNDVWLVVAFPGSPLIGPSSASRKWQYDANSRVYLKF